MLRLMIQTKTVHVITVIFTFISAVDYRPYLEAAASEGTIKSKKTGLGVIGASGVGKTSVLNLLLNQPPVLKHCSTPVARPLKGIWMIANCNKWKHEESSHILLKSIADCVWKRMKDRESANGSDPTAEQPLPQSPDRKKRRLEVPLTQLPSHSSSNSPSVVPSAIQPTAPSVSVLDVRATAEVAEILKSGQDYECLEDMHFVSVTDSGGQAPFIDIAPSLFPYNSINLVVFKLIDTLDSEIPFTYSIDGVLVDSEKRKITTEQLILAAVSSVSKVTVPKGSRVLRSYESPLCLSIGTHYDVYKNMKNREELKDKKMRLNVLLKDFENVLYEDGDILPLNALSREAETLEIAEKIRELASQYYTEFEVPARWYLFQIAIEEMKTKNEEVVAFSTFLQLGKDHNMCEEETRAALQYLHDLNVCLYYPQILSDVVFLSPQYLFDKISEIMAVSFGEPNVNVVLDSATKKRFKKYGIFTLDLLLRLPSKFLEGLFSADDFLKLMCHLHITAPLSQMNGTYLMPCLLQTIDDPLSDSNLQELVEPLLFTWNKTVPHGLFTSLVSWLVGHTDECSFEMEIFEPQFRNKINFHCPQLACHVVIFECSAFIGLANLCPTFKQNSAIRKIVLEGMSSIVNDFKWLDGVKYPEMGYLCKVPKCKLQCPHLCYSDTSHDVLSCAGTEVSLKQTKAHQAWFDLKGIIIIRVV